MLFLIALCVSSSQAQAKPDKDYPVCVLSEAAIKIAVVRFRPEGARREKQIDNGEMPMNLDRPQGNATKVFI